MTTSLGDLFQCLTKELSARMRSEMREALLNEAERCRKVILDSSSCQEGESAPAVAGLFGMSQRKPELNEQRDRQGPRDKLKWAHGGF